MIRTQISWNRGDASNGLLDLARTDSAITARTPPDPTGLKIILITWTRRITRSRRRKSYQRAIPEFQLNLEFAMVKSVSLRQLMFGFEVGVGPKLDQPVDELERLYALQPGK